MMKIAEGTLLDAAIDYASRNLPVLPLHSVENGCCTCDKTNCPSSGKHPRSHNGVRDATTDKAQITQWWQRWPNANIGIATGRTSGIVALDVDPRHRGDETLINLQSEYGTLPATPETLTGGGGRHLFFKYPLQGLIKNSAATLGSGLDVRGDEGYVVAPPSRHLLGDNYLWEVEHGLDDLPFAPAPSWLIRLLTEKRQSTRAHDVESEPIPEGRRNVTLTSLAGTMRHRGMTRNELLAALNAVNRERCLPPLPHEEVCGIAESVSRYPPRIEAQQDSPMLPGPRPVLDQAALHGVAGHVLGVLRPHTEADDVALLAAFLSEFGCLIGRAAHLVLDGCTHPLLLWFVLVGASAKSRKGSSDSRIKALYQEVDSDWTRGESRGTLSSGEGLAFAVRDPHHKEEMVKERGRPTGETIKVLVDSGVEDKRLFLVQPEFGAVLRIMAREGNSLSGVLRDAWDGRDLAPMTKNARVGATQPHIAIVGHITKMELQNNLSETDASNGFGNRFVWLMVQRSKLLALSSSPAPHELTPIIGQIRSAVRFGRSVGKIDLSDDAKTCWKEIYTDLSADRPGLAGSLLARAEAQVLRVAAVYALLDQQRWINVPHLMAALALWQYAEASTLELFGDAIGNADADAILRALRTAGQHTDTQINNLFGGHRSQSRLNRAKQILQASGLIHSGWIKTAGRPQRIWQAGAGRSEDPQ